MSRVMIVAGEASGDLHGANLVLAARELDSDLEFFGTGGGRLASAGTELMYTLETMSLMGGTEVLSGIKRTWDMYRDLKAALSDRKPSALVLIDYPELNLPLAKAAHQGGCACHILRVPPDMGLAHVENQEDGKIRGPSGGGFSVRGGFLREKRFVGRFCGPPLA